MSNELENKWRDELNEELKKIGFGSLTIPKVSFEMGYLAGRKHSEAELDTYKIKVDQFIGLDDELIRRANVKIKDRDQRIAELEALVRESVSFINVNDFKSVIDSIGFQNDPSDWSIKYQNKLERMLKWREKATAMLGEEE